MSNPNQYSTMKQELTYGSPAKGDPSADAIKSGAEAAGAGSAIPGLTSYGGAAVTAGAGVMQAKANHDFKKAINDNREAGNFYSDPKQNHSYTEDPAFGGQGPK